MPEEIRLHGTRVSLWGGWSIALPECYHERTPDGAWAAWGEDWVIDVQIIEMGSADGGRDLSAETLYAIQTGKNALHGDGWIGSADIIVEKDAGRDVFRMTGRLCADKTIMSCWISYLRQDQEDSARAILRAIVHRPG